MSTIYVQREGRAWGPFTTEELEGKVGEGAFTREDLFWIEGMEGWRPLGEILIQPEDASEDTTPLGSTGLAGEAEENLLFDSPTARLTERILHLGLEDIPIADVVKAGVQTETISRGRALAGCVGVGVAIICVALLEVHRPSLTAWVIWGVILLGLIAWWLRLFADVVRPASTMLIVDLRDGDERLLRMEPVAARELAMAIDQAVIAAAET